MKRTTAPAGQRAAIKALRTFAQGDPVVNDRGMLETLEKELFNTSDRVTAVMLGAHVETALEKLLVSRMRGNLNSDGRSRLFGFEGVVGTFSAKIIVAYATKIIGPITYSDLNLIKELRNQFAHSRRPFDFQTPEVVAVCNQLRSPTCGTAATHSSPASAAKANRILGCCLCRLATTSRTERS